MGLESSTPSLRWSGDFGRDFTPLDFCFLAIQPGRRTASAHQRHRRCLRHLLGYGGCWATMASVLGALRVLLCTQKTPSPDFFRTPRAFIAACRHNIILEPLWGQDDGGRFDGTSPARLSRTLTFLQC